MKIRHLYVSPAHNYFGHHGRTPDAHPTLEVGRVRCLAGRGIEGDRFCDYRDNYKGQITLFALEVYEELCAALDVHDHSPATLRRNLITTEVDLNTLIGVRFELQGVELEGVEECRPCYWMDQAFHPGVENWLKGRGGLRARILTDGWLSSGLDETQQHGASPAVLACASGRIGHATVDITVDESLRAKAG